jgi:hypothetical protein
MKGMHVGQTMCPGVARQQKRAALAAAGTILKNGVNLLSSERALSLLEDYVSHPVY